MLFENTGIARKVDDLGCVHIPREIRNKLGIKEGEPLDIFVTKDGVLFRKQENPQENKE